MRKGRKHYPRGGSSTTPGERKKNSTTPRRGGGKHSPTHKGREKQRSKEGGWREQLHPKAGEAKTAPSKRGEGRQHHPKEAEEGGTFKARRGTQEENGGEGEYFPLSCWVVQYGLLPSLLLLGSGVFSPLPFGLVLPFSRRSSTGSP